MMNVLRYDTADMLDGDASDELIRESMAAAPTGAVPAYLDENDVWQYVPPSLETHYVSNLGCDVITVYVEVA